MNDVKEMVDSKDIADTTIDIVTPIKHRSRSQDTERLTVQIPHRSNSDLTSVRSPYSGPFCPVAPTDLHIHLKSHSLFSNANEEFISDLIKRMHFRHFIPGDLVVREGETGRAMFFIVKGFVTVSSKDGESIYADLGPGSFFGEIGLLFEVPRTANVVAKTKCFLAVLTMMELIDIMESYPEIADEIRLEAEERFSVLTPVFQFCTDDALQWISENVSVKDFKEGDRPILKGQFGTTLFVIKSGSVKVVGDTGKTYFQFKEPGVFFGETAPLKSIPRTENVEILQDSSLYELDLYQIKLVSSTFPEMKIRFERACKRTMNFVRTKIAKRRSSGISQVNDLPAPLSSILSPEPSETVGIDGPPSIGRRSTLSNASNSPSENSKSSDFQIERNQTYPFLDPPASSLASPRSSSSNFYLQSAAPLVTSAGSSTLALRSPQSRSISMLSPNKSLGSSRNTVGEGHSFDSLFGQYSPTKMSSEIRNSNSKSSNSVGYKSDWSLEKSKNLTSEDDTSMLAGVSPVFYSTDKFQSLNSTEDRKDTEEPLNEEIDEADSEEIGSDEESDDFEIEIEDVAQPMRKSHSVGKPIDNILNSDPKKRRASIAVWTDSKLSELAVQNANKSLKLSHTSATAPVRLSVTSYFVEKSITGDSVYEDENVFTNTKILSCILSFLDFKIRWKLRRVNSTWFNVLKTAPTLLRVIDLSGEQGKSIDDAAIGYISRFCAENVEVYILKNCWKLTSLGLRDIAAYNKNVEVLDVGGCWDITDEGLTSLSIGCRKIKCIDLSNCRKITDTGMLNLMNSCQNLMDVYLSYCKALSDICLTHLSSLCPNLRKLNLQRCLGITDNGYSFFGIVRHFKLQELQLSDCSFLTDNAMNLIAESCPNLRYLNISFCCAITEIGIQFLVKGCPRVTAFDASFCGNAMSDDSIKEISEKWEDLERLSVRGCVKIGDESVISLMYNAKALKYLNISNCKNVSESILFKIPPNWILLNAQTPLVDHEGINGNESTGSTHVRRFTAPS